MLNVKNITFYRYDRVECALCNKKTAFDLITIKAVNKKLF